MSKDPIHDMTAAEDAELDRIAASAEGAPPMVYIDGVWLDGVILIEVAVLAFVLGLVFGLAVHQ